MKIIVAGDYCPQDRVLALIDSGDYSFLKGTKSLLSGADYSIVNLECPVVVRDAKPIEKCGPNLCCGKKAIEALKEVGFSCVTLANNHFYDYGNEGVEQTLNACGEYEIDTVGGGGNLQKASMVLYKEIEGKCIGIVNCCEHEFSIATEDSAGSNPLNPIQQYYTIKEAKLKAGYVIVIVHGGSEHYQLPTPRMKELYRFFIDAGADAVINHHQHCYTGYEVYKKKPIFYGIGNFCFDNPLKRNSIWTEGFLVQLDLDEEGVKFELFPYTQCDKMVGVHMMDEAQKFKFNNSIEERNSIIQDDKLLKAEFDKFSKIRRNDLLISVMPYKSRIMRYLAYKGFFPSFFGKDRAKLLFNYVNCESHRDTFTLFLENRYNTEDIKK